MTKASGPAGGGLQLERGTLAWRRTALGLTASLMLASRLLAASHPWLGLALPVAAMAAGGILMAAAARRSGRVDRWLRARRAGEPVPAAPGGRLLLVATALAALVAAVGACLVLGVYGPVGP